MPEQSPTATDTVPAADTRAAEAHTADAPAVEEELLVEDVSIDGMCGVY